MPNEPDTDPRQFLEYRLVRVAELLQRRFERALRPHDLTPRQFSVLAVLRARPGITSADLARAVLTTPQGMSTILDQLEGAGLLAPRTRRGKGTPAPLRLSPSGSRALSRALVTVTELDSATMAALGDHSSSLAQALALLEDHVDDT